MTSYTLPLQRHMNITMKCKVFRKDLQKVLNPALCIQWRRGCKEPRMLGGISMCPSPGGTDIKQLGEKGTSSLMIEVRLGGHWMWMSCMRDQWSDRSQQRGAARWQLGHEYLQPRLPLCLQETQHSLASLSLTLPASHVCRCQTVFVGLTSGWWKFSRH